MSATFALLSPCGLGNLGDAAIQDAMIANIHSRFPRARIVGITLSPSDTRARHGIEAFLIAAQSRPGYYVASDEDRTEAPHLANGNGSTTAGKSLGQAIGSFMKRGVAALLPGRVKELLKRTRAEVGHVLRSWKLLKDVDTLIFSGGGQLDDYWGGAWGHPFTMMKWTLLARLANVRVLYLSVGYGSIETRLGRVFTRLALGWANYRSYRDEGSRRLMRRDGFTRLDPVFPDLAYSRSVPRRLSTPDTVRTVGICPIAYRDPRVWPRSDAAVYQSYVERLAQASAWLVQTRRNLVFFCSDGCDPVVAHDVIARMKKLVKVPANFDERVVVAQVATVDDYLAACASVDVVVASRLHGLLLSHLVGTPTLAISYDRKVDVLMTSMDQAQYMLDIETFNLNDFQAAFSALERTWQPLHEQLRRKQAEYGSLLAQQYDRVLPHNGLRPEGPILPAQAVRPGEL